MLDPHVTDLTCKLIVDGGVTFESPPAVEFENEVAEFSLLDGQLTATLKGHFANVVDARSAVESVLRAWQFRAALTRNIGIRFAYAKNTMIDRAPPSIGRTQRIVAGIMSTIVVGDSPSARLTLAAYPDPPLDFAQTQEVEALSRRWLSCLGGREPPLACAYFVLTKLEVRFGNRKNAALELNVSDAVLSKPGFLSSEHGDDSTARKARLTPQLLTPAAENWVRESVPELILRLARYSMGVTSPEPALGHLPMM